MTYAQIQQLFADACAALGPAVKYYHCPAPEVVLPSNMQYPAVIVEDGITWRGQQFDLVYGVPFIVLDREQDVQGDEQTVLTNEVQALNSAQQIALTIIDYLRTQHADLFPAGSISYNAIAVLRDYADRVHGWRVEIELSVENTFECEIPLPFTPPYVPTPDPEPDPPPKGD